MTKLEFTKYTKEACVHYPLPTYAPTFYVSMAASAFFCLEKKMYLLFLKSESTFSNVKISTLKMGELCLGS